GGGSAIHRIGLGWIYEEGRESLDRPNLAQPALHTQSAAVVAAASLWTVQVPAAFRVSRLNSRSGQAQPSSALGQGLHRAAAPLELSKLLARRWPGGSDDADAVQQLRESQELFAWYCRQAEHRLAQAGHPGSPMGSQNQSLAARLAQLRRQNLEIMRQGSLA